MKKKQIKRNILTILEADKEMKLYTYMVKHMYGYNDIHHTHTHLTKMFKNRSDIVIDLMPDTKADDTHILITKLEKTSVFGSTPCSIPRKQFFWEGMHTELAKTETGVYTCTINELKHVFCYPDIKTAVEELTSELEANGNENIEIKVYDDYIAIIDKNRTIHNHDDNVDAFFKTQEMVSNEIKKAQSKGYYADSTPITDGDLTFIKDKKKKVLLKNTKTKQDKGNVMENRNLKLISNVDTALGNSAVTKMEFTEEVLQNAYGFKNQDEAFEVLRNAYKGRDDVIIENDTDNKVIEIDKCPVIETIPRGNISYLENVISEWLYLETYRKYILTLDDLTSKFGYNSFEEGLAAVYKVLEDYNYVQAIVNKVNTSITLVRLSDEGIVGSYCPDFEQFKDTTISELFPYIKQAVPFICNMDNDSKHIESITNGIGDIYVPHMDIQPVTIPAEFSLRSHREEEVITEPYKDLLLLDIIHNISSGIDILVISADELLKTYGYTSQQQAYDDTNDELCHLRGVKFTLTDDGGLKLARLRPVLKTDGRVVTAEQHANVNELKDKILTATAHEKFMSYHITEDVLLDTCGFLNQNKAFETIQEWLKDMVDVVIENDLINRRVVITKDEDINKDNKHQSTKSIFYQSPDGCPIADWFPKPAINEIEASIRETIRRVRTFNDSKDIIIRNHIETSLIQYYEYDMEFLLKNTEFTSIDSYMEALRDAVNATVGKEIAVYNYKLQKLIVQ